jgi:lysophospholipase L1-like esterase
MIHRRMAALVALLAAACGGSNGPTPVTNPPQIACPADVTVSGVTTPSQPVSFDAPTTSGGTAPVNVTCAQSSGSTFPLGTTPVNCTARDAAGRQAACTFNVVLKGMALGATKFLAVGDSLTEGENGFPPAVVDSANAYPTRLLALLEGRFPSQGIAVVNRGVGGERIERTRDRLPGILNADRPDAVLILGGYNNLTLHCAVGRANTTACGLATDEAAFGVRDCIREAKESPVGVKFIFASTLTPPGPVGANAGDKRIDREAIVETNRKIRQFVSQEGATLVDAFPRFVGHESEYVSIDGLHLQPAGYQAIADAFFEAITARIPQTPLAPLR